MVVLKFSKKPEANSSQKHFNIVLIMWKMCENLLTICNWPENSFFPYYCLKMFLFLENCEEKQGVAFIYPSSFEIPVCIAVHTPPCLYHHHYYTSLETVGQSHLWAPRDPFSGHIRQCSLGEKERESSFMKGRYWKCSATARVQN